MKRHLVQQMCDGMDRSTSVIVFETRSYIDKVDAKGPKKTNVNSSLGMPQEGNNRRSSQQW